VEIIIRTDDLGQVTQAGASMLTPRSEPAGPTGVAPPPEIAAAAAATGAIDAGPAPTGSAAAPMGGLVQPPIHIGSAVGAAVEGGLSAGPAPGSEAPGSS
jgi:hypothetical protein